jgi:hypothetical protein
MKEGAFLKIMGAIFALISILHLLRSIFQWPAQIGTFQIPMWFSWIAIVIAALISYTAFQMSVKRK